MITLHLLRAEWLKTRERLLNRGILAIMPFLLAGIMVTVGVSALINPTTFLDDAAAMLPYPGNLELSVEMLNQLGFPLVVFFVATSVGTQYGRDIWKMIVPRYGRRPPFLLAKWVVGVGALLLLIALLLVIAVVVGSGGAWLLDITRSASSAAEWSQYVRTIGEIVLEFIFIGTLTLFGTVLIRSTVEGVITGIVAPMALVVIRDLLPLLQERIPLLATIATWILPSTHFSNLQERWVMAGPPTETIMADLLGHPVSPTASALVVIGHVMLLLGGSLHLFNRRDMAGE